ncbi:hypothetical protein K488DRAFT_83601 [Vararia minispora EC-137]|uniref:Uncharacterized protein n=1 Tax=Vararia minispora EC-137 TaxID=1314806 RepID=A0ACB8QSK9_9AGAM|nr:hypothetical protein K488DRAFT_83601 [Vararia minispora EC-137]
MLLHSIYLEHLGYLLRILTATAAYKGKKKPIDTRHSLRPVTPSTRPPQSDAQGTGSTNSWDLSQVVSPLSFHSGSLRLQSQRPDAQRNDNGNHLQSTLHFRSGALRVMKQSPSKGSSQEPITVAGPSCVIPPAGPPKPSPATLQSQSDGDHSLDFADGLMTQPQYVYDSQ